MAQQPQSLGKTLDDFKRLGKGVAVGETFDILGAPADLADAFFSVRKALFPYSDLGQARAAEDLAKGIGSEALIKKAGINIPEMGFNLESAGRVVAPGFLLTKGAIGLKLLSQMMDKTPPPSGGFAMATTGASKIPDPLPPTPSEQLISTMAASDNLPSTPEPSKKADVFEDDYLKKDVKIGAAISKDGVFFSNLLQEIENIGTGQGELQQIIQTRMPVLETFTTKKGKTAQRPVKDDAGNIMYQQGVTTRVEGIEFPMTGAQILEKFETLKGGINNRLYKEAEETGLIRYLELNPKEKFEATDGKEKLYNIASQFTPELEVNVYKESDQLALDSQISNLKNNASNPNLSQEEKTDLLNQIRNLEEVKRRSNTGMKNKGEQRIDPGGDSIYDVVHTIFGTGSKGNQLLGSSLDRFNVTNTVKKSMAALEDFFKSTGDTTSLKELKQSYSEHGFDRAVDGGYYAHGRAVDGFMGFQLGPNAPKLEDSRFVNELQINQAMQKQRKLIQDSPKRIDEVKRNITRQDERLAELNTRLNQATLDRTDGKITDSQFNNIKKDIEKKKTDINLLKISLNKMIRNPNEILLNSTLMDIQQILKLDKENEVGISTFTETKAKLQDEAKALLEEKDNFLTEVEKLDKVNTSLKEKVFQVDNDINQAAVVQSTYNLNKDPILSFFGEDVTNPRNNSFMFSTGSDTDTVSLTTRDFNMSRIDENDISEINIGVPSSIKKFISKQFTPEEGAALFLKNVEPSYLNANQAMVAKSMQGKERGSINSAFFTFLNSGRDAKLVDRELQRDFYETVDRLLKDKKISPEQFDNEVRYSGVQKGREVIQTPLKFAKYVQMKILDDKNYFKNPQNVSKFFKDAYRNHGLELEQKYIKAAAVKNIVNNNEFRRLIGKDNIKELAQRLEAVDKANRKRIDDPPSRFSPERQKILQDFMADAELDRRAKTKGSQIIEKIINETVDAYTSQNNRIPTPINTGNSITRLTSRTKEDGVTKYKYDVGLNNIVDFTYTAPKKILGVTPPGVRGTVDFKFIDLSPEALKNEVKKDIFTDVHLNVFSEYQNPIIESMANQERLNELAKEKATAQDRAKELVNRINDVKEKLRPFEQRDAMVKLIDKLGDKVPQKIKDSLKETLKHIDSNDSFQLAKNPPVQNSQQGLELMVHRMISDAKKEGKRYIIFPKLADYAAAGSRTARDPKKYNFAVGSQQLGSILKKYGNAYFTKERLYSSSSDISPDSTRMLEIGKVRGAPVNEESDLFRIIDLDKVDSDLKVPRFKKGGILSKFRKVA